MNARRQFRPNNATHDRRHPASGAWRGLALLVVIVPGCSGVGAPQPTASGTSTEFTSEEFASPLAISIPEGGIAYETREAVVLSSALEAGAIAERLVIFRTEGGPVDVEVLAGFETSGPEEGRPIPQPWPDDFAAWLEELDAFELLDEQQETVAGSYATTFDVRSDYQPPSGREDMTSLRIILIGASQEGTDVTVHDEEMRWQFVLFDDLDIAMAYGALADEFSGDRFRLFVDSLAFREQPSPS